MLIHNKTHLNVRQLDLAEQQFVQCADGCDGGNSATAFQYVLDNGIGYEWDMPYRSLWSSYYDDFYSRPLTSQQMCSALKDRVYPLRGFCVKKFERDEREKIVSDLEIQQALIKFGPLYLSMCAYFERNYASGIVDDPNCPQREHQNHAVLLVGYTEDVWILKNCWGEDWGENGFFRVARGDRNICGINTEMAWPLV